MSTTAERLRSDAEARLNVEYVIDQRQSRMETSAERMDRLDEATRLYRGDWSFLTPGETTVQERPKVMNQVQVEQDDIASLVSEAIPSVRILPKGDTDLAEKKAAIREAIAAGYWEYNRAEAIVPLTAMDLAGAGCAFWLPYVEEGFTYPALMQLDPRSCYPTLVNGKLIDLMHITKMRSRTLRALKGVELGDLDDEIELIGFYDDMEWGELAYNPSGKTRYQWVTEPKRHGLTAAGRGIVPVAFAQRDSWDRALRGMFDQMGGSLEAKNRITELILENADQMVYAPLKEWEVQNGGDFGPFARILLNQKDSIYERTIPPQVSPQLFALLGTLEGETRAGGGYPATRQGEIPGSIWSGSGVSASMGQLTSAVRNIQRLIGMMREQANRIMFALDERLLNFPKPLCRTVGKVKTYTPKDDIAGDYENTVVYGAGAGLDKANQYVLALQLKGAGLISNETIMGELSEVTDPVGEKLKIVREQMETALLQKLAGPATVQETAVAVALMAEGKTLSEVAAVLAQMAQEAQAQAAQQQGALPAPQGPEQVQAQATSLEKGGVPGNAPELSGEQAPVEFQPPPSTSIFVGR